MRRGYFPAVFLFAAFRLEPEGAAGEAGGIETALGATRWKLSTRRILPTRSSSGDRSSHSFSFALRQDHYIVRNRSQERDWIEPRGQRLELSEETSEPRRRSPCQEASHEQVPTES
jgi:hypothetical protein